jgi:hypothetical protein
MRPFEVHANFHENIEDLFRRKYCEVNKDINLHITKVLMISQ